MRIASNSSLLKRYNSSLSALICVPPYSGRITLSPTATGTDIVSPSRFLYPGPTARTSPSLVLEMLFSGRRIPPAVLMWCYYNTKLLGTLTFATGTIFLMRTLSARGTIFLTNPACEISTRQRYTKPYHFNRNQLAINAIMATTCTFVATSQIAASRTFCEGAPF